MRDLNFATDFFRTWRTTIASSFVKSLLVAGVLFVTLLVALCWTIQQSPVFLTTTSPDKTYSVSLKGDKGRSFVIPNEVRADVSKLDQPFVSNIWLHSTKNAFDLSFEAGFPDVRWLTDSTVEFYRAQYFEKGKDSLLVSNTAGKPIKYLRVQSENKFLLFDMQPDTSVSVEIPAPRGDSQWIALQGAFTDGTEIPFNSKTFNRRSSQRQHFEYKVSINRAGSDILSKDPK